MSTENPAMTGIMMDLDLDDTPEAAELPELPAGWITVILAEAPVVELSTTDLGEQKAYMNWEFVTPGDSKYPDARMWTKINYPLQEDMFIPTRVKRKNPKPDEDPYLTRAEMIMGWYKKIANAFGLIGAKLAPDMFESCVGKVVSVKLDPNEYQGKVTNRIPFGFNFGDNIKPV